MLWMPSTWSAQALPSRPTPRNRRPSVSARSRSHPRCRSRIRLDSNIFYQPDADAVGDFTATTIPRVLGWMRLGPARVRGRANLNPVYFQDYPSQRSVDSDYEGRFDLVLTRLTPYVSATWVSAKQPTGFEVDERIRRHEKENVTAGAGLELGPCTVTAPGPSDDSAQNSTMRATSRIRCSRNSTTTLLRGSRPRFVTISPRSPRWS